MSSKLFPRLSASDRKQLNRLRSFMSNRESQLARLRDLAASQDSQFERLPGQIPTKARPVRGLPESLPEANPRRRRRRIKKRRPTPAWVRFLERRPWVLWILAWLMFAGMAWASWTMLMDPSFSQLPSASPKAIATVETGENIPSQFWGAIAIGFLTISALLLRSGKKE